jgi:hypothetical protein
LLAKKNPSSLNIFTIVWLGQRCCVESKSDDVMMRESTNQDEKKIDKLAEYLFNLICSNKCNLNDDEVNKGIRKKSTSTLLLRV